MNKKNKSLIETHLAVLLFGISGLFGKLLSMNPMIIVFGRVLFSSIFLFIIILILKKSLRLKSQHYFHLIIMGIVLAIHWSTFFKSIQMSTVAIGLLTFSTFPIFITFIEPYFFKEKIKSSDIISAIITFTGILLVIPKFEIGSMIGVLWGILSGFTYAILSILNKKYVMEYSSITIAFYEQIIATIILFPFFFIQKPIFSNRDIVLLLILGVIFTGISHLLFINGLKNIKAHTAGIISSLEPVYGIFFAALLLKEIPSIREILGGILIFSTVMYTTIRIKK